MIILLELVIFYYIPSRDCTSAITSSKRQPNTKRRRRKPGRKKSCRWWLIEDETYFQRITVSNDAGQAWRATGKTTRSKCPTLMEGERKVILSALTSVGYIEYYIVSVYKVYVHGARVQRLCFYRGGRGGILFLINGLRMQRSTSVCTMVHRINIDFIENYYRRKRSTFEGNVR